MVTVIPASGPGTLAFVISGRLTRADYEEVLLPPVRETIARGEQIRMLAVINDFHGLEPGALFEDLKAAATLGSGQRTLAYFAVVTDADWVRRAIPRCCGGAGINRHGEGDARALHRRSSDPRWPRAVRGRP